MMPRNRKKVVIESGPGLAKLAEQLRSAIRILNFDYRDNKSPECHKLSEILRGFSRVISSDYISCDITDHMTQLTTVM